MNEAATSTVLTLLHPPMLASCQLHGGVAARLYLGKPEWRHAGLPIGKGFFR
jgi:hypothetical protein